MRDRSCSSPIEPSRASDCFGKAHFHPCDGRLPRKCPAHKGGQRILSASALSTTVQGFFPDRLVHRPSIFLSQESPNAAVEPKLAL
jgi:hypothetical protein